MTKTKRQIAAETFVGGFRNVTNWCWRNTGAFGKSILALLPMIGYVLGQFAGIKRGQFAMGGEMLLIIVLVFFALFLIGMANRSGNGDEFPVPYERFTNDDGDGEVTVPHSKVNEMILYLADVENFLERKGLL